jgi:catalase
MENPTQQKQGTAAGSNIDDLARQIFETMLQVHGTKPGFRVVHAKGLVCLGSFTPSPAASGLSRALHFQGPPVPVTVRFSDGSPDPGVAENSYDASPRGIAIRFKLPNGKETDVIAISHNGFIVGNGEDFLALEKSVATTDPSKPHPWPVEQFLGTHPLALKFVTEIRTLPPSFANEAFFSNNAFVFVNKSGAKQPGRYQILPVAGQRQLSEDEAKTKSANYLIEDLKTRLPSGPVQYRLIVQLPNPGDPTKDPSLVWPDDRKTIEVGTLSITSVVADSAKAERELGFFPTNLVDGIELSDDPFPDLRSRTYLLASTFRQKSGGKT